MKRFLDTLVARWPFLLLEIAVLVTGITLSFLLNEWRENRQHREVELRTLEQIRDNLRADSTLLVRYGTALDKFLHGYDTLLVPETAEALPQDSINQYMDFLISYLSFYKRDIGYEALKQTGASRFIQNESLLEQIIGLYQGVYLLTDEWDDINRLFILERMIPYIDDHAPYAQALSENGLMVSGMTPVYVALSREDVFRNLIRTNRLYKEAQGSIYRIARERIGTVLAALDAELAERL